jgi:hypothetical protein
MAFMPNEIFEGVQGGPNVSLHIPIALSSHYFVTLQNVYDKGQQWPDQDQGIKMAVVYV